MNPLSRADLKDQAKEKLNGRFGLLIGVFLLSTILTVIISSIAESLFPRYTLEGLLIGEAAHLIVSAFTGLFSIGTAYIYLKLARGENATLSDLFYAFSHNFQVSLGVSFFLGLISSIPSLTSLFLDLYTLYSGKTDILFTLIGSLVAVVIYLILHLYTAQCEYLLIDEADKSVMEIFVRSKDLMFGNKKRMFFIILSFIPLALLSALSIIGVLWMIPYVTMTYTLFYLDIKKA